MGNKHTLGALVRGHFKADESSSCVDANEQLVLHLALSHTVSKAFLL